MASYKQIQRDVKRNDGFIPKTSWIAHMKEKCRLPVRRAWNRAGGVRMVASRMTKNKRFEKPSSASS